MRTNRPVPRKKIGRVGDYNSLKSTERGFEDEQRYYDKEFPNEQLEDHTHGYDRKKKSRASFAKGGMVKGRDYAKDC